MLCKSCNTSFDISDQDFLFYKKIDVPAPTLCTEDRQRRRIVWRNERFLYHGTCHLCQKNLITMYPPERKFPILCPECFWSDRFDPMEYGRDFDFNRPFFEQFAELYTKVPQLSIFQAQCINSEYTLNNLHNKNCYMLSGADYNEDCMYGLNTQRSKDCIDHILLYDCQLCYGCLWSSNLYNCVGCQDSENCNDSFFLYNCKGCYSCAFSANLRNKKYVLFGEQLTKEAYENKLAEILPRAQKNPFWIFENLAKVRINAIQKATTVTHSENVSGNYIRSSKNAHDVFDAENLEDCGNCYYALSMKDAHDMSAVGWGKVMYECISTGNTESVFFSSSIIDSHDIGYSRCIWNCSDIFGSTSLKNHKQYVSFNKQYSKEEYTKLRLAIIEHMKKTSEFGEFFPPHLSPFEYNRSMAIDHMPLTKHQALQMGFRWYDELESFAQARDNSLPICQNCSKNFRIIEQETTFHNKQKIPLPRICWPCRVQRLISQRRFYKLYKRTCTKCAEEIMSAIPPIETDISYCEKCYEQTIY